MLQFREFNMHESSISLVWSSFIHTLPGCFLFVIVTVTLLVSMFLWFCYAYLKLKLLRIRKLEESTIVFHVPLEEGTSDLNENNMEEKLLKIEKPFLQCMVWSSQPLQLVHACVQFLDTKIVLCIRIWAPIPRFWKNSLQCHLILRHVRNTFWTHVRLPACQFHCCFICPPFSILSTNTKWILSFFFSF